MKRTVPSRSQRSETSGLTVGLLAAAFALVPSTLVAQQSIRGVVAELETGERIDRASVFLLTADGAVRAVALSDTAGRFEMEVPATGGYFVRVQRAGYDATRSGILHVPPDAAVQVRVNLRPDPAMLEAVTITGEAPVRTRQLREFWKRRRQHRGFNFSRQEIERIGAREVLDVLRHVPTFRRQGTRPRDRSISLNFRRCTPVVYVDGWELPYTDGDVDGVFQTIVASMPIDLVYGVEVFTNLADVPAQLQATKYNAASCGVIAVWTESMR